MIGNIYKHFANGKCYIVLGFSIDQITGMRSVLFKEYASVLDLKEPFLSMGYNRFIEDVIVAEDVVPRFQQQYMTEEILVYKIRTTEKALEFKP